MKLPFRPATRRYLLWAVGLSLAHAGATYAVRSVIEALNSLLYGSSVPGFLLDERLHVLRELALASLILLHLPAALLETLLGPMPASEWWMIAGDALLYGLGIATLVRWLNRPPAVFSRFAPPFVTRQSMTLATLLAAAHVALSALLYFGFRFATAGSGAAATWADASQALAVLHPWLLKGGLRPYGAADPMVIAVALIDALAWGLVAAVMMTALRRALFR